MRKSKTVLLDGKGREIKDQQKILMVWDVMDIMHYVLKYGGPVMVALGFIIENSVLINYGKFVTACALTMMVLSLPFKGWRWF